MYALNDHLNVMINSVTKKVKHMQMENNPRMIPEIRKQVMVQMCDIVKFYVKIYE